MRGTARAGPVLEQVPSNDAAIVSEDEVSFADGPEVAGERADIGIDAQAEREGIAASNVIPHTRDRGRRTGTGTGEPKKTPPSLDEWQDFFSRIIIRTLTNFYVDAMFKGIDEERLTLTEVQRMYLGDEERDQIAKPFAELANKLKFTRKHGRTIVAATDSIDSVLILGRWFIAVNRIAGKYKNPQPLRGEVVTNVGTRQSANGRQEQQGPENAAFTIVQPGTG